MSPDPGTLWPAIAGALVIHALGAMSPGPNFVIVARNAVAGSSSVVWTIAGIVLVNALYIALGLAGFIAILVNFSWMLVALKIAGGTYLAWVGLSMWREAATPLPAYDGIAAAADRRRAFREGVFTNLSNVKAIAYYFSFFTLVFDAGMPIWAKLATAAGMMLISLAWYSAVAFFLSLPAANAAYRRAKRWIDRAIGGALGLLGARLAFGAQT
jgi:threonine/homoserine/homoserine lactone efflux protein